MVETVMPAKLERCVKDVQADGKSEDSAWAICTDSIEESIMKEVLETKLKGGCGCNKKKTHS